MRIFHVTRSANVESIRESGFRANEGHNFADRPLFGDVMFEGEEGPFSAISVEIPDEELSEYEDVAFQNHHAHHREWIQVPAELVNRHIRTAQVHEDPGSAD